MKFLDEIKVDSNSTWIDLATSCRKENVDELVEIEDELLDRYDEYDDLIENYLDDLDDSEFTDNKDLLKEYYEKPPAGLKKLILERRNDHELLECPFCGNPRSPDTLDHFIPKDNWPEFAIHPNNLVPQCRGCAPTKGEKYYCNDEEKAIFVHPIYSDILSKFKFKIVVEFSIQTKKPTFSLKIQKPRGLDNPSRDRVVKHLRALKLNQRVMDFCNRDFTKWKNKLKSKNFDIRIALNHRIHEREENEQSKNWKTSLYLGMLENNDLINYLNSLSPAESADSEEFEEFEELEL